ncbi:reverse transcriptase domain-containing protein [Tanacetum coccineum]|uniref:Reverse transcriptase domain-containing protein n=1 Tax=Tanacetum coccineum TaxID=301880 RepID=A0ABQ5CT80_9ASTR
MACSLPHTDYEVEALAQKLIDEDKVCQNAILDLAFQFEMESNFNNENDPWEFSLDIDDFGLRLTLVLCSSSRTLVEDVDEDDNFKSGPWISATKYVNANGGTVSGCLGDIDNNLKKRKLNQVLAIVKSCSPNVLGDLTVTMNDLPGTIPRTIHYKVIGEGAYGKDITVGADMILANVSVFSPKQSMHYFNITKRNVVKVFRKLTVPGSGSG